jgi:hypothetical protein
MESTGKYNSSKHVSVWPGSRRFSPKPRDGDDEEVDGGFSPLMGGDGRRHAAD